MLDTDVCVFFMDRTRPVLTERILRHRTSELCISAITAAELAFGVDLSEHRVKNEKRLNRLRDEIPVAAFDSGAGDAYGAIRAHLHRRGALLGPLDMLIAAHAKALGATLVTYNEREFRRVPGLKVERWA